MHFMHVLKKQERVCVGIFGANSHPQKLFASRSVVGDTSYFSNTKAINSSRQTGQIPTKK